MAVIKAINVAEKPSVAKELANILGAGSARRRQGQSNVRSCCFHVWLAESAYNRVALVTVETMYIHSLGAERTYARTDVNCNSPTHPSNSPIPSALSLIRCGCRVVV